MSHWYRHDTITELMRVPGQRFDETYKDEVIKFMRLFQEYFLNLRSILHPNAQTSADQRRPSDRNTVPDLPLNENKFPVLDPTWDFGNMTHRALAELLDIYLRHHWCKLYYPVAKFPE